MTEPPRDDYVPRPPKPKSTTDFIVLVFVIMVACILFALTAAVIITALFTDDDVGPFLAILTDLVSSIIAALVGFMAGRGVAKEEGPQGPLT